METGTHPHLLIIEDDVLPWQMILVSFYDEAAFDPTWLLRNLCIFWKRGASVD